MTNCNIGKLIEFARVGSPPDRALRAHLQVCDACQFRFDAEKRLTSAMDFARTSCSDLRSTAGSRDVLMNRFDALHAARTSHRWVWAFAAAAMLLLAAGIVKEFAPAVPSQSARLAASGADNSASPASIDSEEDGFIAVPYVPPLATGELVRVVHTQLDPAALASLGINVDPTWTTQIPADLLVAEDGSPRAVRLTESSERTI